MSFRRVFQTYIENPEVCLKILLHDDENVLIIKDAFPKALRHYLIIPKSPDKTHIHPLLVFQNDAQFYTTIKKYVEKTKKMIMDDLFASGLLQFNRTDTLAGEEFKNRFIKAGVHSIPSLDNLHIHVITQDFHSHRLKHKKHYNSFTTKFFVEYSSLEPAGVAFSLNRGYDSSPTHTTKHELEHTPADSARYESDPANFRDMISKSPLKCTYCDASFGKRFSQLKAHLQAEFVQKFAVSSDDSDIIKSNKQ